MSAGKRPPHEVGKPCPNRPSRKVTQRDFDRQICRACGAGLLSLDAYMDRGGR
jgi:hypothetical protein